MRRKKNTYLSGMLLLSQDLTPKLLGKWLTLRKSQATKHHQDKEELIEKIFKQCVITCLMMKRSKKTRERIFCMLEFPLKNKWATFLDNLNTSEDQNILSIQLFKILVQELILKGKEFQQFWTPVFKELSEKLSSHTEIDSAGLDLTSSISLLKNQEEKSQSLKITKLQQARLNLQKTYSPLSTSTLVDKWEKEATLKKEKLRTIKIKIYPTKIQKKLIDELFDVTRYLYNKANKLVKEKKFRWKPNYALRDYLVTIKSRKGLTTPKKDFELVASDSTRQCAIQNLCDAYKTATRNLEAGNIRSFDVSYKKKNAPRQCLELGSKDLNMTPQGFKIYTLDFKIRN